MPDEIKRIPLYIASKQSSVRVPLDIWKKMKYNEIDTGESLNTLMIKLLVQHFETPDQVIIFEGLQAVNANELINELLIKYLG
jgi:hypothetical protein